MADLLANSVIEMQENKDEILKTGIKITNIYVDESEVFVSLNNTGP